jgi:ribonuclease HI
MAPADESPEISSRSEYAIRAAKYRAFKNDARGWRCTNGDMQKILNSLIKERIAPVHFLHLKKKADP